MPTIPSKPPPGAVPNFKEPLAPGPKGSDKGAAYEVYSDASKTEKVGWLVDVNGNKKVDTNDQYFPMGGQSAPSTPAASAPSTQPAPPSAFPSYYDPNNRWNHLKPGIENHRAAARDAVADLAKQWPGYNGKVLGSIAYGVQFLLSYLPDWNV